MGVPVNLQLGSYQSSILYLYIYTARLIFASGIYHSKMIPQTILLSSVLVLQTLGFVAAHPTPSDVGLGVDVDTVVPEDCYPCDDDHDYGHSHSHGGGDNDDYTEIVTTTGGLPGYVISPISHNSNMYL